MDENNTQPIINEETTEMTPEEKKNQSENTTEGTPEENAPATGEQPTTETQM